MSVTIGETLRETAQGILAWVTNELRVYAKNDDAAKVRVGGPGDHGGALSFNKLWIDSATGAYYRETELGLFQVKQDERTRGDANGSRGEMTLHLCNGREDLPEDQRMVAVLLFRTDGFTPLVPFLPYSRVDHGPSVQLGAAIPPPETLGPSTPSPSAEWFPNKLVSPDGRVELDIQNVDALNMTLYRDGEALWSVAGGLTQAGRRLGWRA